MSYESLVAERPRALLGEAKRPARLVRPDGDAARFLQRGVLPAFLVAELAHSLAKLTADQTWTAYEHLVRAEDLYDPIEGTVISGTALTGESTGGDHRALYGFYVRSSQGLRADGDQQQVALVDRNFLLKRTDSLDIIRHNPGERDPQNARKYLGTLTCPAHYPEQDDITVEGLSAVGKAARAAQVAELNQLASIALEAIIPDPGEREDLRLLVM